MAKKGRHTIVNNIQELNLEIDYDKLAEAIVKARCLEKENEAKKKAEEFAEWQAAVGCKEYSNVPGIKGWLCKRGNDLVVFFKMCVFSKKKYIGVPVTNRFVQTLTAAAFNAMKVFLDLVTLASVAACFYHPGIDPTAVQYLACCMAACCAFLFSRIFRLMAIEVEQMSNTEQVLGIFTAVISVSSLIGFVVDLL